MRILYLSDLHQKYGAFAKLPPADLILIGGDFTNCGSEQQLEEALHLLEASHPSFYAVGGNLDTAASDKVLRRTGHLLPMDAPLVIGGYTILGVGGSNLCPVNTPNQWPDEEMERRLLALELPKLDILVTHAPPHGFGADRIPSGLMVGSKAIAVLAAKTRPALHLCGHIHEAVGIYDENGTILVNPGPFGDEGHFADIRTDENGFAVCLRTVQQS